MSGFHAIRLINAGCALSFVASAAFQYNDPDPARWISLYLMAAGACLAWEKQFRVDFLCGTVGLSALVWSLWIAAQLPSGVDVPAAFSDWGMAELGSELVREIGGLAWVTACMGWLMFTNRFRSVKSDV